MAHLWGPCLPGSERSAKIPVWLPGSILPRPPCERRQERESNTSPPEADGNQKCPTSLPPLQYKRSLNSNAGRMDLWGMSPPSSRVAGLPNQAVTPCPGPSPLGHRPVARRAGRARAQSRAAQEPARQLPTLAAASASPSPAGRRCRPRARPGTRRGAHHAQCSRAAPLTGCGAHLPSSAEPAPLVTQAPRRPTSTNSTSVAAPLTPGIRASRTPSWHRQQLSQDGPQVLPRRRTPPQLCPAPAPQPWPPKAQARPRGQAARTCAPSSRARAAQAAAAGYIPAERMDGRAAPPLPLATCPTVLRAGPAGPSRTQPASLPPHKAAGYFPIPAWPAWPPRCLHLDMRTLPVSGPRQPLERDSPRSLHSAHVWHAHTHTRTLSPLLPQPKPHPPSL